MNTYSFETIINSVSIKDVLDHYGIGLRTSGNNQVCSIRNESKPSCSVRLDKNTFADYGIGANGNVFNLVAYLEYGIISNTDKRSPNPLSPQDALKVATFIGDTFGVTPASYTKNENGWMEISNGQFKQIGLYGDKAIKNLIDLRYQTIDEADSLEKRFGNLTMVDLSKTDKNVYYGIIENRALPFMYNKKKEYLLTVRSLTQAKLKGDESQIKVFTDKANSLYKSYISRYDILKRAIPPLTEEEKVKMQKQFAVNTKPYNIYPVDKAVERYMEGKESIQIGNATNSQLKDYCNRKHEALVYYSCSKDDAITLANANPSFRYAIFDNGVDKEDKLVISEKDMPRCLDILGKEYLEVDAAAQAAIKKNPNNLSDFGLWFEHYIIKTGFKKSDIARSLGIDGRRLSELLKANAKLSTSQQNMLNSLMSKVNYKEYQSHSYTYAVQGSQQKYIHFNELHPTKQDLIVERIYNSPSNKTQNSYDGVKESREAIHQRLSGKYYNQNFLYSIDDLKQINIDQIKPVTQKLTPHSREYAEIKSLSMNFQKNPYIIRNLPDSEQVRELFEDMKHLDYPFYAKQEDSANTYWVALVHSEEQLNKFVELTIKKGVDISMTGAKGLIYSQDKIAAEMSLRDGIQYTVPNNISLTPQNPL